MAAMGEQGASTGGNNGREEGQAGDIQNVAATTASNQGKFNVTPSFDKDEQNRNQQEAGGHTDGNHKQDGAIDPNSSQDKEQITVSTWIYSLSFRWRKYLIAQIPLLLPSVILMLLGFKDLPKSVPLFRVFSQHPVASPIIGGVLLFVALAALLMSFGPKPEPKGKNNGSKTAGRNKSYLWITTTAMSTTSFLISSAFLMVVLVRPLWCPPQLCFTPNPIILTDPKGVHDDNLELAFKTLNSMSYVLPGNPTHYSLNDLPQDVGALRVDKKTSNGTPTDVYQVILGVHSLLQDRYEIIIDQVNIVVDRVDAVPQPLNVWLNGSPVNYTNNPYLAIYNGQKVGESFTAAYIPVPYAHVHLTTGESDVLTVQMSSQQFTASITFHVGVVYSLTSDPTPQRHTLRLLSKKFEVVFSNTKNWHAYQLQDGVLVARP